MKKKIALFLVVLICAVGIMGSFGVSEVTTISHEDKQELRAPGCPDPRCPGRLYRYGGGWKCDTCLRFFYL